MSVSVDAKLLSGDTISRDDVSLHQTAEEELVEDAVSFISQQAIDNTNPQLVNNYPPSKRVDWKIWLCIDTPLIYRIIYIKYHI